MSQEETCDLCATKLPPLHDHLLESGARRLLCSCPACALLFEAPAARYRRVPRDVFRLPDFRLADADWARFLIPIDLVFFFHDSMADRVVALYPSPAGATEATVPAAAWVALAEANPVLRELAPDVEALLVDRRQDHRDCYRAPIDECYRLVGLLRSRWRGFSGGVAVWREVDGFFATLRERSQPLAAGGGGGGDA